MKKKRFDHDAYFTRRRFDVETLLEHVRPAGSFLEPCVGAGDIARFLPGQVFTNDIDHGRAANFHHDATTAAAWRKFPPVDWVITNPPFSVAHQIVPRAFDHARKGVAMLLRLTFLEPVTNRAAWLEGHPVNKLVVLPRFSFDGSGKTDSVTCAWMVWEKGATPAAFVAPFSAEKAGQGSLFTEQP